MCDVTRLIHRLGLFAVATAGALIVGPCFAGDRQFHLLISEVVGAPDAGEYIEIYNPSGTAVDLSNYYLADTSQYSRVPNPFQAVPSSDFVARFPAGASIAAGGRAVIAVNSGFPVAYGLNPHFELPGNEGDPDSPAPNMLPAFFGFIGSGHTIIDIGDAGEAVMLFHWDGQTDLVQDVDIVLVGTPSINTNFVPNKSGISVDGPDAGTVASTYHNETPSIPNTPSIAGSGFSYKRRFLEGANEISCGGNGILGHHEVTENTGHTWDGFGGVAYTAPTPTSTPTLAIGPGVCIADIVPNNAVNINDLLAVIIAWGPCAGCLCAADIYPTLCKDCQVNINDLLAVIINWGPCL